MEALITHIQSIWEQAQVIWMSGGWAMMAIAVVALIMFGLAVHIWLKLQSKGFERVSEKTWRRWIDNPSERRGKVGRMLDFVTGGSSLRDTAVFFEELRVTELAPFPRDLRVMRICVTAAPLLGLLGTVIGMLTTFGALATGSGGEKTMALVAGGISEALITTETGLVIALPGLFVHYQLTRKHERYKAFLAHLETVCTQEQYRRIQREKTTRLVECKISCTQPTHQLVQPSTC